MGKGYVSISKETLSTLEAASFKGDIVVIENEKQLTEALAQLRKHKIIGFDTETKPNFKRGHQNNVSLIQLATDKKVFLIRVNKTGFTKALVNFFEEKEIKKIGLSIKDDFHNLYRLGEMEPENFIDLQSYVKDFLINDNSLTKIYAVLFNRRICKGQRLTNWEADELTNAQQQYAALDAFACLEIYNYLQQGNFDPTSSPYYTTETAEENKNEENQE